MTTEPLPPATTPAPERRPLSAAAGPILPGQDAAAEGVLARAFHHDPIMVYAFPDPAERAAALPVGFRLVTRFARRHGVTLATTPRLEAAGVWIAPGGYPATEEEFLELGMGEWPDAFGAENFERFGRGMETMERTHVEAVREPHWFLWALGVEPTRQGRGLGSAILREGLRRVDRDGVPCYLETFEPRNLPLYERHGFEVVADVAPSDGVPRMWGMLRPARGGGR